jgi:hypothetical protein
MRERQEADVSAASEMSPPPPCISNEFDELLVRGPRAVVGCRSRFLADLTAADGGPLFMSALLGRARDGACKLTLDLSLAASGVRALCSNASDLAGGPFRRARARSSEAAEHRI